MNEYKVIKTENGTYESADVVLETDEGFEWICECGYYEVSEAREYAELIAKLLNEYIKAD